MWKHCGATLATAILPLIQKPPRRQPCHAWHNITEHLVVHNHVPGNESASHHEDHTVDCHNATVYRASFTFEKSDTGVCQDWTISRAREGSRHLGEWETCLQSTCECALQPLSPILHVKLCRILPDILSLYTIFPSTNVIHIFSFRPSNLSFIFHHPEDFENPKKSWKNSFRVEVTIAIHSNQATETKKNQRKEWNGQEDRHLHDVLEPPKKRYHLAESVLRLLLPSNFTIFAYKICVEVLEKKCWDLTKKFKKFAKINKSAEPEIWQVDHDQEIDGRWDPTGCHQAYLDKTKEFWAEL